MLSRLIIAACAVLSSLASAGAAVPSLVNYQGILTDGGGTPQIGTFSVTFSIYGVPAGGTALWTEIHPAVTTDAGGHFSTLLGSVTALDHTLFSAPDRWLGIAISPDGEMTPRHQIVTTAYAFRSATVDGATGGTITSKVSIGSGHTNTGVQAFVAGENNIATGDYSSLPGGIGNRASQTGASVGGGSANEATAFYATIGGGSGNDASSDMSTVAGGVGNEASGIESFVGGGRANRAISPNSTIGGGNQNFAFGFEAAVLGGRSNSVSADYAAIGGGQLNTAFGQYGVVPGGVLNKADAYACLAAGRQAQAITNGTFVWADSGSAPFISSARNQFLIRASGGVGIGTNNPSEQLHVVGNVIATGCVTGSNIVCPSDLRFKRNVVTIDHALHVVEQLRGVQYDWNRNDFPDRKFHEGRQVGLIAQEVQEIVPQAVVKQSDGYLAVDYARLVPLLIESIKEQQKRIEALEKKLERQTP